MTYLVSFLEGIVTFISPCLLPMLPIYIAYFAGGAGEPAAVAHDAASSDGGSKVSADDATARTRRTLVRSLGFVCGFTLLFCLLGALSGTLGSFFTQHRAIFDGVCGAIVVVFGLHYLGVIRIGFLDATFKPVRAHVPRGFFSSVLFGMVFAIGWTPCVGVFLGSALSLAATSASAQVGVGMLICYSLGLGIPFVLSSVLIDRLEGTLNALRTHRVVIDRVCGVALVVLGIAMMFGWLGTWMGMLAG